MDEDDDGVNSADLEAEAELEAEYYTLESNPERFRIPPDHRLFGVRGQNVVHANQDAHYYNSGFTQGANEADGAGPASSDEEETGPTGL